MDIKDVRIDMRVCTKEGYIGTVVGIQNKDVVIVSFGPRSLPYLANQLEPETDACESCQKLQGKLDRAGALIGSQMEEIGKLSEARDHWVLDAIENRRNAAHWREELTKLQTEALADSRSFGEVAKIHIQISPAVLASLVIDGKYSCSEE